MARTKGRGNPIWSRDETILALELYHEFGGHVPSKDNPKVRALSEYLRGLPYHGHAPKNETFRNPDGVIFKLNNLGSVATGKGLPNVSTIDRAVWSELGGNPEKVKSIATQIRESVKLIEASADDEEEGPDEEFEEGRFSTKLHKRRERNRNLRKRLLKARRKAGPLRCEGCGISSPAAESAMEDAIFEAHHIVPVAQSLARKTQLKDMALLCANCHRLIHRIISKERRWVGIAEARMRYLSNQALGHEVSDTPPRN